MSPTTTTEHDIIHWLQHLQYPLATTSQQQDDLLQLIHGEFAQSLAFLSSHALGRHATSHIKRELHSLRQTASSRLSLPRREELGLEDWPNAVREITKVHEQDQEVEEDLQEKLKDLGQAGERQRVGMEELMNRRRLLLDLERIGTTTEEHQARIDKLATLLEEWIAQYSATIEQSDPARDVTAARKLLRDPSFAPLPPLSAASPSYLQDLSKMFDRARAVLQEHVERNELIRPPPINHLERKITSLQQTCLDLAASTPVTAPTPAPSAPLDKRDKLILELRRTRARRQALEAATRNLQEQVEPSLPPFQAVQEAERQLAEQQERVAERLALRAEVITRIEDLVQQLDTPTLPTLLDHTVSAHSLASPIPANLKQAAQTSFSDRTKSISPLQDQLLSPLNDDLQLAHEARLALHTNHLLATHPPLAAPLASSTVENYCNSLTSARTTLLSHLPPLLAQLDSTPTIDERTSEVERLVTLRESFLDGKLLPQVRSEEKTLSERWKKGEKDGRKREKEKEGRGERR